ncbi:hypothetical protein Afil01_66160 [Actinorhabdospora filicis]|uniref:Uncharacterized protein n=1 Tax=Actinorhabdospora filicis TaxID=1785913 RepID=A0A9W6SRZ1_9ACTN|nr:hypothetical protein [Actinorhabdospora filicis]GLZ81809.1 hypothetical protein Afil01_66160 [Actinorhabdospora filicis]
MGDESPDITKHKDYDKVNDDGSMLSGDWGSRNSYVESLDGLKDNIWAYAQIDKISENIGNLSEGKEIPGSLMEIGVQITDFAGNVGGMIADPIGWLAAAGLGVLIDFVQPLEDILGMATGNPERMEDEGKKWSAVIDSLEPLAKEVQEAASTDLSQWDGEAAAIAKRRLGQLSAAIVDVNQQINWVLGVMEAAKAVASILQDVIKTIIGGFIGERLIAWAVATSTAAVSFGASFAAFIANTLMAYSRAMVRIMSFANRGANIFAKILKLVVRLGEVLGKGGGAVFAIVKTLPGVVQKGINAAGSSDSTAVTDSMQ